MCIYCEFQMDLRMLDRNLKNLCRDNKVKSRRLKHIALLAVFFLVICLCRGCCNALFVSYQEIHTSPQGTNTVIVEYDYVCKPYVYKKTWFGKRHIWTYPGGGFMESVSFSVEWLSEDEIRMIYDDLDDEYDEEFIITIL